MDAPFPCASGCSLHDFARERDGTIRLSPHESGSDGRVILAELLDGDGAVVEARPLPYENLPPWAELTDAASMRSGRPRRIQGRGRQSA